ncbi:Odorant-binding protein 83b [Carabus blaptoides fortunei]
MDLCKNKTGISDEAAKNLKPHQVPQTHDEQCYLACINHELETVFPNNTMNLERIKHLYTGLKTIYPDSDIYEKSIKVAEICATKVTANSDDCAAAKIYAECYVDEANKVL